MKTEGGILAVVHMKQLFVTDNYHIQDEGHGHGILYVHALWSVNPVENTGSPIKSVKSVRHWIVAGQHFGHSKVKKVASYVLSL